MIHTSDGLPSIILTRYPTFLSRLNESFFIPWRTAAFVFHISGLITAGSYRRELVVNASLMPNPDPLTGEFLQGYQEDYDYMLTSANWAIAASATCLVIILLGFLSARTISSELNNIFHGLCHSVAGGLFMCAWVYEMHVARLWHIWYFWGLCPALVEMYVVTLSIWRGTESYK
eukprot:Tbor_TRINITY_DN1362_c0_g1::TRINITY_DN1362_c0_g1_i1::g.12515::m.12515